MQDFQNNSSKKIWRIRIGISGESLEEFQINALVPDASMDETSKTFRKGCPWRTSEDTYSWRYFRKKFVK